MAKIVSTKTVSLLEGNKLYAKLRHDVTKAGLLDRSYTYYAIYTLFTLAAFFLSAYLVVMANSIPWVVLWGVIFSFFMVQLAGLLHDAGHRSIFKSAYMNDVIGLALSSLVVMGYSGWKIKHNIHHAHTNEEDEDPDLDLPVLSFTAEHYNSRRGFQKFLSRYQAYLYYPIGTLVSFSVRITSMRYFIAHFKPQYIPEIIMLLVGSFVLYILPFLVFDISKATTFVLVNNVAVGFYLLNVFAPNHKGMPVVAKKQKFSFLEQQVMTSRNIFGNAITDYIYMGLNYQIEHHLFPNCPRNNLKKLAPYIKNVCQKLKIDYTETSILESNKIILSELHTIARAK